MHGMELGAAGMHNQVGQWAKQPYVGALDSLDLQVEVNEKIFSDSGSVKELQKMEKRIIKDMTDYLGITARVKLVEPNTLKTGAKIIDKRRY